MIVLEYEYNNYCSGGDDAENGPYHPRGCRPLGLDLAVGLGLCVLAFGSDGRSVGLNSGSQTVSEGGLNIVALTSAGACARFRSTDRILPAKRVRNRPVGDFRRPFCVLAADRAVFGSATSSP